MITSWKHKGLERFFKTGSKAEINPKHVNRLKILLQTLNAAVQPEDMNLPSFDYHPLTGKLKKHYSVSVSGNWRLIFKFEDKHAVSVDYLDYH